MNKLTFGLGANVLAMATFGLVACGDETTTNITEQTGMQIMAASEKMDKCDDRNAGEMIFVTDSSAVFYCADGKWQTLNGKDGADGMEGKPGTAVNGEAGKSCTAADTISADGIAGYNLDCADKRVGTIWSGKDGEDGKSIKGEDGKGCTAADTISADGIAGYNLDCADKRVGTIWNGKDGEEGKSIKGEDGKGCTAADTVSADGIAGYNLDCADKRVGTIWNGKDGEDGKDLVAEYDTVTTEFLNQEMLAEGKYGILVDKRDNKVYRTIEIGNQTWMAQNLNYSDGGVTSYCIENVFENCAKFGRIYTWATAMNLDAEYNGSLAANSQGKDSILVFPARGICPEGYHIPDSLAFETLIAFVNAGNTFSGNGELAGTSLKSQINYDDGSDLYGFSAVATGHLNKEGEWNGVNEFSFYWTSTERLVLHHEATIFALNKSTDEFYVSSMRNKHNMTSVRCLKNSD